MQSSPPSSPLVLSSFLSCASSSSSSSDDSFMSLDNNNNNNNYEEQEEKEVADDSYFSLLSDELIVEIFYYGSPLDLLGCMSLVNKRLSGIARGNQALWKTHSSLPNHLRLLLSSRLSQKQQQHQQQQAAAVASLHPTTDFATTDTTTAAVLSARTLNLHQLQICCIFNDYRTITSNRKKDRTGSKNNNDSIDSASVRSSRNAAGSSNSSSSSSPCLPDFLQFGSIVVLQNYAISLLLKSIRRRSTCRINRRACLASTTDQSGERIENVLYAENDNKIYDHEDQNEVEMLQNANNNNNNKNGSIQNNNNNTAANASLNNNVNNDNNNTNNNGDDFHNITNLRNGPNENNNNDNNNNNNNTNNNVDNNNNGGNNNNNENNNNNNLHELRVNRDNWDEFRFMVQGPWWWSSLPTREQNTKDEILLFPTKCPLSLITCLKIKPFTETWNAERRNEGGQTYTWQKVVIRIYHIRESQSSTSSAATLLLPEEANNNTIVDDDDNKQPYRQEEFPRLDVGFPCTIAVSSSEEQSSSSSTTSSSSSSSSVSPMEHTRARIANSNSRPTLTDEQIIQKISRKYQPVYESPVLTISNPENDSWQRYTIPNGGVIGNLISITLIGKNYRQFVNTGYYLCVEKVKFYGIPLYSSHEEQNEQYQHQRKELQNQQYGSSLQEVRERQLQNLYHGHRERRRQGQEQG